MANITREELIKVLEAALKKGELPKWVFHGMDSRVLKSIQEKGLLPNRPFPDDPRHGVWFTPDPTKAAFYAEQSARANNVGPTGMKFQDTPTPLPPGKPHLLRTRLAPLLKNLHKESLEDLAGGLEDRITARKAGSTSLGSSFLPGEVRTSSKGLAPQAMKIAKSYHTSGNPGRGVGTSMGKFSKLSLAALLLGLLSPALSKMMNPPEKDSA